MPSSNDADFRPFPSFQQRTKRYILGTIFSAGPYRNRPDTVGQPPSAENYASYMPSLKAQEYGESGTVIVSVWRGNRMTNSIWALIFQLWSGRQHSIVCPDSCGMMSFSS